MDFENARFELLPKANFEMDMGDSPGALRWSAVVKKTWVNRLKWWLFFQFFPFKLVRWDKETYGIKNSKWEAQP